MNRIGISPARRMADLPTVADLEARAEALGVIVSTEQKTGRHWGWLVRVRSTASESGVGWAAGDKVIDLRSNGPERGDPGPLLPVIAGALDDFEATYPAWTADELLTVAAQSGIAVRRA